MFVQPLEAIAKVQRLIRRRHLRRLVKGHDVVPGFLARGYLHQRDVAGIKARERLDPDGGTAMVGGLEILEMLELSIPLGQAEALDFGHVEQAQAKLAGGVVERAPDARPLLHLDLQTVRVMHLGTEVIGLREGVLAKPEHAAEGRDAERFHRLAQVHGAFDKHLSGFAWHGLEAVGPHHAGSVEQRQHFEETVAGLRLLKPEMREVRELFGVTANGVDRQGAGGQAVAEVRRHRTEVAGAHEHQEFEAAVQERVRSHHPEAGKAVGVLRALWHRELAPVEKLLIVTDRRGLAAREIVHAHGLFGGPSGMEKLQAERLPAAVLRHVLAEADLPGTVILELVEERVERLLRRDVRLVGKLGHQALQRSVVFHPQGWISVCGDAR